MGPAGRYEPPGRVYTHADWENWRESRRLGLYPELEWTFPILNERVCALSGEIPALFYEYLSDFDSIAGVTLLSAERSKRRNEMSPRIRVGVEVFESAYRVTSGRLPVKTCGDEYRGQHIVPILGVTTEEELVFRNSWGERWGLGGLGFLSRSYFEAHATTAIASWPSINGPSPQMFECFADAELRRLDFEFQWLACWEAENHSFQYFPLLIGNVKHILAMWQVRSLETLEPVWVFELRNPARIVGRAHLETNVESGEHVLQEFFVCPRTRRRGVGAVLDDAVVQKVKDSGGGVIQALLHRADSRPRNRACADPFARRRGYKWNSSSFSKFDVAAVATKVVTE